MKFYDLLVFFLIFTVFQIEKGSVDVKILGRLCDDPIERTTTNNKNFAAFSFVTDAGATDSNGKRKPLFININAWGKQSETIMKYCKKGTQLLITGNVYDISAYTRKTDGSPAPSINATLDHFEFSSPKRE